MRTGRGGGHEISANRGFRVDEASLAPASSPFTSNAYAPSAGRESFLDSLDDSWSEDGAVAAKRRDPWRPRQSDGGSSASKAGARSRLSSTPPHRASHRASHRAPHRAPQRAGRAERVADGCRSTRGPGRQRRAARVGRLGAPKKPDDDPRRRAGPTLSTCLTAGRISGGVTFALGRVARGAETFERSRCSGPERVSERKWDGRR
jgi:hypothetical protein